MLVSVVRSPSPDIVLDEEASEAELLAQARHDPRAFAPLYARFVQPVYRYCHRRLGDDDAAADATSQVFAKALSGLPRCRDGSFRSWLFAIAHNTIVDGYRERRPREPLSAAMHLPDAAPTPEEQVLADDERRLLRALLDRLPPEQRTVVELRLAGLTGAEIAAALGRSLPAIKSIQFRAYARLRLLMREKRLGEDERR